MTRPETRPVIGTMEQLTLDLGHRPALGREDFLVAPGNEIAVAWIDRWPDWPNNGLALYGPPGCGKSHLIEVWRAASAAVTVDAGRLAGADPMALLGAATTCVIDAAERAIGDGERERGLFHLYNVVVQRGGHLLLTGRSAPGRWAIDLPDLRSRLAALPSVALGGPDDAQLQAVLVKLFADRQLAVKAEVLDYLTARMERSFGAARALVAAIDRAALAQQREITIPLARAVLESGAGSEAT